MAIDEHPTVTGEDAEGTTHSRGDKAVIGVVIAACVIAAAIIGYLLLRPIDEPPAPPQPTVTDTKAADEAAALKVAQQATDAGRDAFATGSAAGLEKFMTDSELQKDADEREQLKGLRPKGEITSTYKVRDSVLVGTDKRVVIARCDDLTGYDLVDANGKSTNAGKNPPRWTFTHVIVSKTGGQWLQSYSDTTPGWEGSCSLDKAL